MINGKVSILITLSFFGLAFFVWVSQRQGKHSFKVFNIEYCTEWSRAAKNYMKWNRQSELYSLFQLRWFATFFCELQLCKTFLGRPIILAEFKPKSKLYTGWKEYYIWHTKKHRQCNTHELCCITCKMVYLLQQDQGNTLLEISVF